MPDFETAWANKEAALDGYKRALSTEIEVQAALNNYLDAAHDAMQAGLELLKGRTSK